MLFRYPFRCYSLHIVISVHIYITFNKISIYVISNNSCYLFLLPHSTIRVQVPRSFKSYFVIINYEQRIERGALERHEKLCMTDPGARNGNKQTHDNNGARRTNAMLSHSISTPWRTRQSAKWKTLSAIFGISRVKEPRRARVVLT